MLCGPLNCGCAIQSSTLNISGSGTPADPWVVEQAEFTDITTMQADIAALQSAMTAAQGDITDLETAQATLIASVARLDTLQGGSAVQGGATGPTSGAVELVVATATVGPFGQAGTLFWGGQAIYTKTVAGDVFSVVARLGAAQVGQGRESNGTTTGWAFALASTAVTAVAVSVIDIALFRAAGTGTATTVAGSPNGAMRWWFLPT